MRSVILSGVSIAMLTFVSTAAQAGCHGSACYQQVVTAPVYASESHQVLVAPARRIAHRTPAQYNTVQETVVVQPERRIAHRTPAQYSTVAETVMVSPGGRHWQVSTNAHGQTVGCWVDTPAQYTTQHRQVVTRPAGVEYETIPAVTATRARTVLARPAGVEIEEVPAQFQTVSRQVQVAPATASWVAIGGGYSQSGYCGNRGLFGSNCAR